MPTCEMFHWWLISATGSVATEQPHPTTANFTGRDWIPLKNSSNDFTWWHYINYIICMHPSWILLWYLNVAWSPSMRIWYIIYWNYNNNIALLYQLIVYPKIMITHTSSYCDSQQKCMYSHYWPCIISVFWTRMHRLIQKSVWVGSS